MENSFNLLGAEHSQTEGTRFVGVEHLYDLGMVYRGCTNDCLSVIYTSAVDKSFEDVVTAINIMLLSNSTIGSKVQVLYDPKEIELAYISLALRARKQKKESQTKNVEIVPDTVYNLDDADNVTLLVAITEPTENVINKLIAQANEGTVPTYIVTNFSEVADAFIRSADDDYSEDAVGVEDDGTFSVPKEIADAISSNDFSKITKEQALNCPQLFKSVTKGNKEYIALSATGKPGETVYFKVLDNDCLSIMKNGLD